MSILRIRFKQKIWFVYGRAVATVIEWMENDIQRLCKCLCWWFVVWCVWLSRLFSNFLLIFFHRLKRFQIDYFGGKRQSHQSVSHPWSKFRLIHSSMTILVRRWWRDGIKSSAKNGTTKYGTISVLPSNFETALCTPCAGMTYIYILHRLPSKHQNAKKHQHRHQLHDQNIVFLYFLII